MLNQRTLKDTIEFEGIALHSGEMVEVKIHPAPANTGIRFVRSDIDTSFEILANPKSVVDTTLSTRIGKGSAQISTIEHLMAAFYGLGIDNAIVEVDNIEIPVLDGSSVPYLTLMDEVGVEEQNEPKKIIEITKTIEILDDKDPTKFIRIEPSKGASITYGIDYPHAPSIGVQNVRMDYTPTSFLEQCSFARTFGLFTEVDYLRSIGLAKGGSMENAVVFHPQDGVMNSEGLRNELECVRHKVLDCVGDLMLLGAHVQGDIYANKGSHELHTKLALAIEQQTDARRYVVPSAAPSLVNLLGQIPKSLEEVRERMVGSLAFG